MLSAHFAFVIFFRGLIVGWGIKRIMKRITVKSRAIECNRNESIFIHFMEFSSVWVWVVCVLSRPRCADIEDGNVRRLSSITTGFLYLTSHSLMVELTSEPSRHHVRNDKILQTIALIRAVPNPGRHYWLKYLWYFYSHIFFFKRNKKELKENKKQSFNKKSTVTHIHTTVETRERLLSCWIARWTQKSGRKNERKKIYYIHLFLNK